RLSHARRQLQKRLARRGIELGAALAALSVAEAGVAAILPALLVASTVRAATTAGGAMAGVSTEVAGMVHGALKSMAAIKFKIGLAIVFMTGMIGAGMGVPALRAPESPPVQAAKQSGDENAKEVSKTAVRADGYGDPLPDGAVTRLGTMRFNH